MKKTIACIKDSIRQKPINLILILVVLALYFLNNGIFKHHTSGWLQYFMICHFNDFICPLFFFGYCNLLLITANKEIKKLHWILLMGLCSGLVWEYFAPVIKPSTVSDVMDLVFYLLGTFLYWCILKLTPDRRKENEQDPQNEEQLV